MIILFFIYVGGCQFTCYQLGRRSPYLHTLDPFLEQWPFIHHMVLLIYKGISIKNSVPNNNVETHESIQCHLFRSSLIYTVALWVILLLKWVLQLFINS